MKKANVILFILIVLLLLPTVASAKSNKSYLPLGISVNSLEYANVPFLVQGDVNLSVYRAPEGDNRYGDPITDVIYPFERDYHATAIHILQNAAWAADFEDGKDLGEVTVCYIDESCEPPLMLTIGVNTEEWASDWPVVTLNHTQIKPAWTEWNDINYYLPYFRHAYYESIQTDPGKTLDYIKLHLVPDDPEIAGVNIEAITLEVPEAYNILGSGGAGCTYDSETGEPLQCTLKLGVSAYRKTGEAWPIGDVYFRDQNYHARLIANDIRSYGRSLDEPGDIFFTGYGVVFHSGITTTGCRFDLFLKDNGDEGDSFKIWIYSPSGPPIYSTGNFVSFEEGDIIVKTK